MTSAIILTSVSSDDPEPRTTIPTAGVYKAPLSARSTGETRHRRREQFKRDVQRLMLHSPLRLPVTVAFDVHGITVVGQHRPWLDRAWNLCKDASTRYFDFTVALHCRRRHHRRGRVRNTEIHKTHVPDGNTDGCKISEEWIASVSPIHDGSLHECCFAGMRRYPAVSAGTARRPVSVDPWMDVKCHAVLPMNFRHSSAYMNCVAVYKFVDILFNSFSSRSSYSEHRRDDNVVFTLWINSATVQHLLQGILHPAFTTSGMYSTTPDKGNAATSLSSTNGVDAATRLTHTTTTTIDDDTAVVCESVLASLQHLLTKITAAQKGGAKLPFLIRVCQSVALID